METRFKMTALAGLIGLTSVTAAPVFAEEGARAIEEVTVTARRREESLQDVPMAVTALSGEDLARSGADDITRIAEVTPSVTLEPSRATNTTLTAFIRGVGQQDPLAGFEQGVALYIDDVYIARPQGSLLSIYDVERVEVLRGPQGTLYGRNAVGGAIKYVTRKLSGEPEFWARTQFGDYGQVDAVLTGAMPLGEGLAIGATVASFDRDGYGDNLTTGGENYDKDIVAWRVSAEWTPSPDWFVRAAYDKTDDRSSAVAGYRPFPGALSGAPVLDDVRDTLAAAAVRISTAGIEGKNEIESEGVHLSVEWNVNENITLRSITADREDLTLSVIDFDSLESMDFDAPVIYDNEQFSQEFQLLWNSDRLSVISGLYFLDATASNDFDVVLGTLAPGGITAYTGGVVDTRSWSLFVDATWDITDRLAVSVGGRYTDDERTADIFRANYLGFGSPFFDNASAIQIAVTSDYEAQKTFTDFSPRINLSYALSDSINVYGGFSQGFKAGSFDPRGANFVTPEVEEGFDPETLNSYELGFKHTAPSGRATTNIAVFYSDYEDMQIPGSLGVDSDGDGVNDSFVGAVTNAGEATIKGIELEGQYALTDQLSANLALSLLDAEIDTWLVGGVNVADQREIQNTPEEMVNIGLSYTTDVAGGALSVLGNWSYKGDIVQFEVPAPVIDQSSYDLINASVVWNSHDGRWALGLHGKNLTDEDVKTAGYCFGSGGCPSTLGLEDNTTVFYGPPRTWSATIEYSFVR